MGTTSVDLYRSGNAISANLDKVRQPKDVDIGIDHQGNLLALAINGKGVSTWDQANPRWRVAWHLPAGSYYDDQLLLVWEDNPGHWMWAPAADMIFGDYIATLRQVNGLFVKV